MKITNKVKGKTIFTLGTLISVGMLFSNFAAGLIVFALVSLISFEIHGTKDKS
jgi:hypothetical protein